MIKQINPSTESGGIQPYDQNRIYAIDGISPALKSGNAGNTSGLLIAANTKAGIEIAKEGDSINLSMPKSKTRRGRVGVGVGVAQTLDTQSNQATIVKIDVGDGMGAEMPIKQALQIRRLTEIECERLQGFKDNHTQFGIYEKSVWINKKEKTFKLVEGVHKVPKTQRYKMIGNAVTKTLPEMIGRKLLNLLTQNKP